MFRIIYPNRWLFWFIVISVIAITLLWWQITLFSIEQEHQFDSQTEAMNPEVPLVSDNRNPNVDSKYDSVPDYPNTAQEEPLNTPSKIVLPQAPLVNDAQNSYTSTEYNFRFTYPSTWQEEPEDFEFRSLNEDLVFVANFADPVQTRNLFVISCLYNKDTGWTRNPTVRKRCEEVINTMSQTEINDYKNSILKPINIFVRVYKTEESLTDWLNSTYKHSEYNLDHYQPGPGITLGDLNGVTSNTGCCMTIDTAYVVKNGAYIYEFGSSGDRAVDLIETMKGGFEFLTDVPQTGASPEITNMSSGWETYTDDTAGFSLKIPPTWTVELTKYPQWSDYWTIKDTQTKTYPTHGESTGYPIIDLRTGTFDTIESWLNENVPEISAQMVTQDEIPTITINGITGRELPNIISEGGCERRVVLFTDTNFFSFFRYGGTCQYNEEMINQVISSFRVLN